MEVIPRILLSSLVVVWTLCISIVNCSNVVYPIGAIFDRNSADLKTAFEQQIAFFNVESTKNRQVEMKAEIQELDATDSFAVSNAICSLLSKGVYGIIGVSNASALSTIQSYSNTFKVPFVALNMAQNSSNRGPFQLFMRPMYINGLLDVIISYGWSHILYIYDTDEGLIRLQQLFQAINGREMPLDIDVKRVYGITDCYEFFKDRQKKNDKENIRVLLDIPIQQAEGVIIKLKHDPEVQIHKFHFLIAQLRMEEMNLTQFRSGGVNITGFQLLNYTELSSPGQVEKAQKKMQWLKWDWPYSNFTNKLPLEPALVIDAVNLFEKALKELQKSYGPNHGYTTQYQKHSPNKRGVLCTDSNYVSPHNGSFMMEIIKNDIHNKKFVVDGITGKVKFDKDGYRKDFNLQLFDITMVMGLAEVGSWSPGSRLKSQEPSRRTSKASTDTSRHRWITTVKDKPYMMYKDEATAKLKPRCGNEHFMGFCADLIKRVAEHVGFNYTICLVKDGNYGVKLENGTWNGMVGELTRDESDLAVAGMTITSQRERVVDFTKPFMSLGISIMIKKTAIKKANVFSFMDPLSYEIWMCILFAYIGVSVVLFLVSRFSPSEWHVDDSSSITNDFTISNSLWYSLGAFMQQGCDISPRSVSGRIVGSVWWFFTLIIISSYTANLAAFLTVERMLTPIESAEDLAKQTEIQYGTSDTGSTYNFFQSSKFAVHERMWAYMQSANPTAFVKSNSEGVKRVRDGNYAYLIESTTNDYINTRKPCDTMKVGPNLDSKGYGIATPIGSDLRDKLTLAVLKLRESGELEEMKKEWWERRSECPTSSTQDGGQTELDLSNVAGIFYILVAGLVLSVVIACLEFLYKSKIDSSRSQKSFGKVLRNKARLSFRGSLDRDTPGTSTPLRKSMSTYTYTGPTQMVGTDGYPDNTHTQV